MSATLEQMTIAARAALPAWALVADSLELIKYRENAVFAVRAAGKRYALRVHRQGYHSDAALRSELEWMRALDEAGVHTPTIISTTDGRPFTTVSVNGFSGYLQIDLFAWIDGTPLGSVEEGVADVSEVATTYRRLGEIAADVHHQSSSWNPPADFVRHSWDAEGLAGAKPFWGVFWELEKATPAERQLLAQGRDRVYEELSALPKDRDCFGLIHADFAPENLMVEGEQVRLIDFDDAGFGWHMFELATALYFIQEEPYFDTAKAALIAAYTARRPLSEAWLETLPLFLLARSFTYLGWVHSRPDTETAMELTPWLKAMACQLTENYLD